MRKRRQTEGASRYKTKSFRQLENKTPGSQGDENVRMDIGGGGNGRNLPRKETSKG